MALLRQQVLEALCGKNTATQGAVEADSSLWNFGCRALASNLGFMVGMIMEHRICKEYDT